MKALTLPCILQGASTRADNSLTLRFCTPELEPSEKTAIFELLNKNLKMLLQPTDSEPVELKEVKGQFDRKTCSQRMRGLLFVAWKQTDGTGEFEDYYRRWYESAMDAIKSKLEPEHT